MLVVLTSESDSYLRLAPNHTRANNNKIYYEKLIKNRTLTQHQRKDHLAVKATAKVQRLSQLKLNESYKINNERPDDSEEEIEDYEELCRQNGSRVSAARLVSLTSSRSS